MDERLCSPNSPLPPDELDRLQACIEAVNRLLLTLGTERDPANTAGLRHGFRALRGRMVRVMTDCDPETEVVGMVQDVGRDFLRLDAVEETLIPFVRICSLRYCGECKAHGAHEPALHDIDPCLRRDLVLRFGEVVSASPWLLNVFFGIPLHLHLQTLVGCRLRVLSHEGEALEGRLCEVDENAMRLAVGGELRNLNLDQACVITVL